MGAHLGGQQTRLPILRRGQMGHHTEDFDLGAVPEFSIAGLGVMRPRNGDLVVAPRRVEEERAGVIFEYQLFK